MALVTNPSPLFPRMRESIDTATPLDSRLRGNDELMTNAENMYGMSGKCLNLKQYAECRMYPQLPDYPQLNLW